MRGYSRCCVPDAHFVSYLQPQGQRDAEGRRDAHHSTGDNLHGLMLPDSLAGRLEAQIQLESQSIDNFRRLDKFLLGLFEALQRMDSDVHRLHLMRLPD